MTYATVENIQDRYGDDLLYTLADRDRDDQLDHKALDDHRHELLDTLGATVESQTRRRIEEEQTAPDGSPWPTWSSGYAATRHGNQSLLQNEGHLVDSLHSSVWGDN
ncbi:phage virion morphogenesis protein [Zooshikella sp. WH53]|uniref:Phage virion morphogenesis protein n=1 Tax=Zooshikella harenae TaxID=2827238 RepID=A0ABS5ZKF9_9GAMM|nr:phage virion morphogenesis protein [Zooshikella harenae]